MSTRRPVRSGLILLAALAVIFTIALLFQMGKAPPEPAPIARRPVSTEPVRSAEPAAERASPPAMDAAPQPGERAEPPVIESVDVEKSEVCEGEENIVTVRARGRGRSGPLLRVKIGSKEGTRVPIRAYLDERGRVKLPKVIAFVPGAPPVEADLPHYRVNRCDPKPVVRIRHQALPNSDDEIELLARVLVPDASAGHPRAMKAEEATSFEWSFGDGASARSAEPRVSHDYGSRPQDAEYSYFLVEVKARLGDGRVVTGRDTLDLQNLGYHFAQQNLALITPRFSPRFPVVDDQGVVTQTVSLRHASAEDVTITRLNRVMAYEGDVGSSPAEDVDPASILGSTTIPAGSSISFTVKLRMRETPDVMFETYEVHGHTASGMPAAGSFAVMRPPPDPTPTSGEEVTSPAMIARIERAQQRLGKELVTQGDLIRLEQEGSFDDLPRAEETGAVDRPGVGR
ncbi:hypothetical protein [Sorangium sp. So ce124]|uniref:hypothetical protein n=1 Tax=Sorangium sp. So ce124 TaxID=3133280 RepID=UPI003F62D79F